MTRCIGMRAGFDGSPVVAGRQRNRIDAVHDALVVRRRAVRIGLCKIRVAIIMPSLNPLAGDILSRQVVPAVSMTSAVTRARSARFERIRRKTCPSVMVSIERCHALAHAVDEVRSHGIPRIYEQMDDEHFAVHGRTIGWLRTSTIYGAAATGDHARMESYWRGPEFPACAR